MRQYTAYICEVCGTAYYYKEICQHCEQCVPDLPKLKVGDKVMFYYEHTLYPEKVKGLKICSKPNPFLRFASSMEELTATAREAVPIYHLRDEKGGYF